METITELTDYDADAAMDLAPDGTPHVAIYQNDTYAHAVRNGSWAVTDVPLNVTFSSPSYTLTDGYAQKVAIRVVNSMVCLARSYSYVVRFTMPNPGSNLYKSTGVWVSTGGGFTREVSTASTQVYDLHALRSGSDCRFVNTAPQFDMGIVSLITATATDGDDASMLYYEDPRLSALVPSGQDHHVFFVTGSGVLRYRLQRPDYSASGGSITIALPEIGSIEAMSAKRVGAQLMVAVAGSNGAAVVTGDGTTWNANILPAGSQSAFLLVGESVEIVTRDQLTGDVLVLTQSGSGWTQRVLMGGSSQSGGRVVEMLKDEDGNWHMLRQDSNALVYGRLAANGSGGTSSSSSSGGGGTSSSSSSSSSGGPSERQLDCQNSYLGIGDGCDCGCGVFDSDCTSTDISACQFCYCTDDEATCSEAIQSSNNALCN